MKRSSCLAAVVGLAGGAFIVAVTPLPVAIPLAAAGAILLFYDVSHRSR